MQTGRLLAVTALLLVACYSPNIPNGAQKCSPQNTCASGYECGPDGRCYKSGQVPKAMPDAGVPTDMAMACTQTSCKAPSPICDSSSGQCVPCLTDNQCPDGKLCMSKQCVAGCSMSHGCGDAGMCTDAGLCSTCMKDADCAGDQGNPRCDTGSGRCVACLPTNDNCTNGQFCKLVNGQYTCATGCKVDSDCKSDGGPVKVCCQNTCVDTTSDGANCGACGKACANGQACCTSACTDTTMDLANCGACGKTCSGGQANWACAKSACTITGCQGFFMDCNSDPSDGCEINTASDPKNCTACGMKCNLANAVAGCSGGCNIASCNPGFGNCDNVAANGCETTTSNDKANCGVCGMVCPNVANSTPSCANSKCGFGCNAGFGDCDLQAGNGCEATLTNDPNNCNMCGNKCTTLPNSSPTCAAGMCSFQCNANFANCDGVAANGCEVNTQTDANNCSKCGMICGGGKSCVAGACVARMPINGTYATFIAATQAAGTPNQLLVGDTVTESNNWGGFFFKLAGGVTKARITITGAGGSAVVTNGGGSGGTGTVDLTPAFLTGQNQTGFWVILGQAGKPSAGGTMGTAAGSRSFNGGGAATDWSMGQGTYTYAGGGGGGSDLRFTFNGSTTAPQTGGDPTLSFPSRFAIVGGGGGGTANAAATGGFGAGFNGNGGSAPACCGGIIGGSGATTMAGGSINGSLGMGGDGKQDATEGWAGGGGGGYYGGGAAPAHTGGGGGSGYLLNAAGLTQVSTASGTVGGNATDTQNGAFTIVVN